MMGYLVLFKHVVVFLMYLTNDMGVIYCFVGRFL